MAISSSRFLLPLGMILLGLMATAYGQKDLYVDAGGKRFTIMAQTRNWYQANFACVASGMSLAAIESEPEYTALKTYLINKDLFGNEFWLSGSNLDGSEFIWLSNGNKLSYTQWHSGVPTTTNACIYTNTQFKWVSAECANLDKKYYICSRPLVPNCGITGRCKRSNNFN